MKENKIEISKIEINIGGKTLSLKPEQAKELKKILNEMFEESTDKSVHHYWWSYPHTYTYPYSSSWPSWTITSGGTATTFTGTTDATSNTVYLNAT